MEVWRWGKAAHNNRAYEVIKVENRSLILELHAPQRRKDERATAESSCHWTALNDIHSAS